MVLYCEQVVDRSLPVNWLVNSWSTSQTRLSYILRSLISPHYSWFATTWQGGHVGGQNIRVFSRRIYMEIEFSSQRREMLFFLTTNMATNMAVTSCASQQLMKSWFQLYLFKRKAQTLINVMSSFNSKVPSFPNGEKMKNTAALLWLQSIMKLPTELYWYIHDYNV